MCPCETEDRLSADWQAFFCVLCVPEPIQNNLKVLCPDDPIKYDFAMFGFGVQQRYVKAKNLYEEIYGQI